MSRIEFISHEAFPEDEYNKEIVYLSVDRLHRVAYVRKKTKEGGLFWSIITIGITKNGRKEYFPSYMQDSNFLEKDIKEFLEKRRWETTKTEGPAPYPNPVWQPKAQENYQGWGDQMSTAAASSSKEMNLPF